MSKTRKTLLLRVKDQHDDSAWEEFSLIYSKYIYAIIRNMGISVNDADDIMQKVMLRLWDKLPQFDYDELRRFRSYLAKTVKFIVLNYMRDNKKKHSNECEIGSLIESLENKKTSEFQEIADREWRIHLTNLAFQNLTKNYPAEAIEVLNLSLQGLDVDEIVVRTELSLKQVYNIRFRMKERFTKEIKRLKQDLE